jgi:selenide,water dikinase
MNDRLPSRDVVLIGAGHTNMHVVRMWRMQPIPDARLTLISPFSRATYSGMLPGTLAGLYTPEEMEIDLYRFATPSGVRVVIGEAIGLDPDKRRVLFQDRPPLRFDVASVGVGSMPLQSDRWPDCDAFLPIKPMATFRTRFNQRLEQLSAKSDSSEPIRIVVVGAGAAGVEVTMCLEAYLREQSVSAAFTVVDSGATVLKGNLPGTIKGVTAEMQRRNIDLRFGARVEDVRADSLHLSTGDTLSADIIIWVTGAAAPPLIGAIPLPRADDGFLAVGSTLQTTADAPVFAVGDSASLIDNPVRKSGVYAVREGPILWDNLQRFLSNRPLVSYDPQKGFNSMLADGEGGAFVDYKGVAAHGKWVWRLKDRIDRKFMRMYQDYQPMSSMPAASVDDAPANTVMRCRGCGGKAGGNILSAAFERLAAEHAEFGHPAFDGPEDAARIDPSKHVAELVTVDFFQAFFDDPWIVGRVAALNALSDIQATGGQPFGTLAQIQLTEGHPRQQTEMLYQVLSGALAEFERAGVQLLGGHTTEGQELTVGFTVLGSLGNGEPFRKSGLQSGDELILTKPLGTGVLLAAMPRALTRATWIDAMLASMLTSNGEVATAAIAAGATAMTDVTGFGLAGHLLEMLDASEVDAHIPLATLPLLDGATDLISQGVESTLAPANRHVESRMSIAQELRGDALFAAMFDPQTSGGLLIAAPPERNVADRLTASGHSAFRIGTVQKSTGAPRISVISTGVDS